MKESFFEAEIIEEIKKTDEINHKNKNIKKSYIPSYMGFKKNFKKISSEVLNKKKDLVNNFEENKVSDNLIKTGKNLNIKLNDLK